MSKARELSQRAGVDGALSNRNKVINGSFLVWQRSDNAYNGGGGAYVSADRFMATRGRIRKPNTNGHSGEDNTGAVFDSTDGNIYVHFDYFIEDIGQKLNGKTMTLSFKMKSLTGSTESLYYEQSGVDYFDIGGSTSLTVPTEWTTFTFTGTVVSTGHVGGIHLPRWYLNTTGSASSKMFQIDEVQFEEGDTATPFEHRSYGQELALTQRFYRCGSTRLCFSEVAGRYGFDQVDAYQYRVVPSCTYNFQSSGYGTVLNVGSFNPSGSTCSIDVQTAPGIGMDGIIHWTADAELYG